MQHRFLSSQIYSVCLYGCRFFYMVVIFFVFRMRFYAAWCGAEAGCISAGLGCYPQGALAKPGGGPTVQYRSALSMNPHSPARGRPCLQTATDYLLMHIIYPVDRGSLRATALQRLPFSLLTHKRFS